MRYFEGIVHKEPHTIYGISFPDAPGCFSAGETINELLKNAQEALELYFEENPDISPKMGTYRIEE